MGLWAKLGAALALGAICAAQAASPTTAAMTLHQALDTAAANNLELQAARQRRAIALAGVRIAGELPNPSVSAGFDRATPHESVSIDQTLELGPKRSSRIAVAKEEGRLIDVEIDTLERDVRRRTREAFFRALWAQAEAELARQSLETARRLRQIAQDRYEAGDVAQLEVLQADLEVARADIDVQSAEQQSKGAQAELKSLLNVPKLGPLETTADLEALVPEETLEDLQTKSYAANSQVRHLEQELKVEAGRTHLLKVGRIPNLDVQFGADLNSPPEFDTGAHGQLTMTLPLFARNQGELAQSAANQNVLRLSLAATKRTLAGQMEGAYWDLEAKRTQVNLYRSRVLDSAEKLESMSEESYKAGKTNILTLLDAQRRLNEVKRGYLDSLLAMQVSFAELENAVGTPLD